MANSRIATSSITQGFPKSKSLLTGNDAIFAGSYESIATATGTGSSGTITFSSIPATYTHLQIRCLMKNTSNSTNLYVTFNGDSTSNYSAHYLYTDGQTRSSAALNGAYMFLGRYASSTAASVYGANVIDILDYANTNKYKTARGLGGYDTNGGGEILFSSGNWRSTAAITSITLNTDATNWTTATTFALYGIK